MENGQADNLDYSSQYQADDEIGEVYEEESSDEEGIDEDLPEPEGESDDQELEGEGEDLEEGDREETTSRTPEETKQLAAEFFGLDPQEIVVGRDGGVKIIQKINGVKRLITPEDYKKGFGLNQAGYEKLNEGKSMIKQFRGYLGQMKQNPKMLWQLADKLGLDKEALAEQFLSEKVEEYDMTPEQKREKELQDKVEAYERNEEQRKYEEQQRRIQGEVAQERDKIGHELVEAMIDAGFKKSDTGKNSRVMYNALTKLQAANRAGIELSCRDAVHAVKTEWQDDVLGTFNDIDENHIISLLPDEVIQAIRKADIGQLKRGTPPRRGAEQVELEEYEADNETTQRKGRRKQSISDYFDNL